MKTSHVMLSLTSKFINGSPVMLNNGEGKIAKGSPAFPSLIKKKSNH
jgi:hypothetical protein